MSFCPKCGNNLNSGDKFCGKCGQIAEQAVDNSYIATETSPIIENQYKSMPLGEINFAEPEQISLEAEQDVERIYHTSRLSGEAIPTEPQTNFSNGVSFEKINLENKQPVQNSFENYATPYQSEPEVYKSKKPIIPVVIAFGALLIVAASTVFYFNNSVNVRKNPVSWIGAGISKAAKADTMEATTKISLTVDNLKQQNAGTDAVVKMLKNIYIQADSKTDSKNKIASVDVSLVYKEKNLMKVKVYVDDNQMIISAPALYSKNFYVNVKDLSKLQDTGSNALSNSFMDGFNSGSNGLKFDKSKMPDLSKYTELANLDNTKGYAEIKKTYGDFFSSKFDPMITRKSGVKVDVVKANGEKDSVNCDELGFSTDSDAMIEIAKSFALKVIADKNIKPFAKAEIKTILDLVKKNGDLDKLGVTEAQITEAIDSIDLVYDTINTPDVRSSINGIHADVNVKLDGKIDFDSNNYIRAYNATISTEGDGADIPQIKYSMSSVVNSINEKITIDKPSTDGAIDLTNMSASTEDKMSQELISNLQKIMSANFTPEDLGKLN